MKKRNKDGTFQYKLFKHSNFSGLYLMLGIMAVGAYLNYRFQPVELYRPLVGEVHAQAPVKPVATPKPLATYNAPTEVVEYLKSLFGDDTQNMLTIIGTCENGTWDQTRTHTNRNGTKDWGLAQINDVNSKLCVGLDFKNDWKDNLACAHRVYKNQGLKAWACSHKVNIKSFWQ